MVIKMWFSLNGVSYIDGYVFVGLKIVYFMNI